MSGPAFQTPLAAVAVKALPEGDDWLYEVKLDGYRALILKDGARVQVRSRNDKDLAYPSVVTAARRLNAQQAVIDGEIVAVDEQGRPSFQALQHRGSHPKHRIVFYAFDLLHLNGRALVTEPLTKRRALLPDVVNDSGILLSHELPGSVVAVFGQVALAGRLRTVDVLDIAGGDEFVQERHGGQRRRHSPRGKGHRAGRRDRETEELAVRARQAIAALAEAKA